MSKETINEIVSQEAFTQLQKLSAELVLLNQQMNDNIANVDKFNRAMSGSASTKEAANNINNVNSASEKLNQTNSQRLEVERKIKAEGDKMAAQVKAETNNFEQLNAVMQQHAKTQGATAKEIVRLNQVLDTNKKMIKQLDTDLKNNKITNDQYIKSKTTLIQKQTTLKQSLSDEQKSLKTITRELNTAEGSQRQMSARLTQLKTLWKGLTQEERENINVGGVLKQEINNLDESLKGMEKGIGENQRNVGNYEVGIESIKSQIRSLRDELSGEMLAMDQLNDKIKQQKIEVDRLLKSKGAESAEYQESVQALNELTKAQNKSSEAIQELQTQGGKLQDIYGDASKRISALSSDFANTDAAVEGVGVMADAYSVLQSTMVGLGIESEGLMDIFAKIMILQQGINSVSQITKALQSESILRTKLETAWLSVKNTYNKKLVASQLANNAATAAGNVATGASVGIFKKAKMAIQAMNAALASNPWMLLAMAIIAAVAALIKFLANQKAERVEALNKAIDTQNKTLAKNRENLDKTVEIMEAWGIGEQRILNLKEAQIKADLALARATMNRIKNDKDATDEQKNNATTVYNEQVILWNNLQQQQKIYNIKITRANAQAAVDAANKAKEEADAKIEQNKKAWEKKVEDNKKFSEKTMEDIKIIEYQSKTDYEKLQSDLADAEKKRQEDSKKYPQEIANIDRLYILTIEKLHNEYNENEKARLEELEQAQIEHYDKLKGWAVEAYNEISGNTRMQEENEINDLIIQGVEDTEAEKLKIRQKYATEERKLFEDAKAVLIAGGMSQEEWTNKHKQLKADETIATENSNNFQIQSEKKLREERQAAAMEAVNGFASLGSAIAQNIKDEKERMRVEAAIALVQALVNQGIAIAKVVAEDEGDPYTKAVRIIANVAAIAAAMVSATSAFRQAASAMPYAEGTEYHKGGDAIVGERYEPELVLMKNKPLIIDKPTFFKDMPIGTKVIPFSKMESGNNMLSMTETNDLLRAIKEKQTVSINVSDRVTSFINSKLGYTKILNSKFKA